MLVSVRTANQSSLSEIISNWRPFRTIETNRNIWFCTWWLAPWETSKRLLSLCISNGLICFLHYLYSKYFLEETMPFWDSPANVCKFTKNTEWILSPRFTDPQSFKNVQEMQENKGGHLSFRLHLWFWFFLLLLCCTYFQCSALGLAYYRCFINADRMSNRVGGSSKEYCQDMRIWASWLPFYSLVVSTSKPGCFLHLWNRGKSLLSLTEICKDTSKKLKNMHFVNHRWL